MFYVLLLEQNITKKKQADKKLEIELEASNNIKSKVKVIWDSAIYAWELIVGHLPGLYYLISWKNYFKEENIWDPTLAVQYLQKLLSFFYIDYLQKLIATFSLINFVSLMTKPSTKFIYTKQKYGQ